MRSTAKRSNARKTDIHDVAAHARVSIATVSRALNHVPTVDSVLAARVWKAVSELNYLPNTQARALVSGKSRLLGLIVSDITNPFFPELIQQFEHAAVEHGYEILIGSTSHESGKMETCVRRMLERKVDGVAVMTFGFEEVILSRLVADDIPLVFIDVAPNQQRSGVLSINYRQGIGQAVEHLCALGHSRIAFISGPLHLRSAQSRKAAFLEALKLHNITARPDWIVEANHTLDGGRDAMHRILAFPHRPTAVMCSNDMTAIGVQHAAFEAQLHVPRDLSLVGFDDIHLAAYTIPPLTTIQMSCAEIARNAVGSLLSHLTPGTDIAAKTEAAKTISTRLIIRQTTAPPPPALSPDTVPVRHSQAGTPGLLRQVR